jgi:hypothetical protein
MLMPQSRPPRRKEDGAIQTFLPYPDFERSVRVLDTKRLGKQRVETLQIIQVLLAMRWDPALDRPVEHPPRGWRTHPAVLMWQSHELALLEYQRLTCAAWTERGFGDTCAVKTAGLVAARELGRQSPPPWLGDEALHRSHQSNLIRKAPDLYGPLFPGVPDDLPYYWPVRAAQGQAIDGKRDEQVAAEDEV